MTKEYAVHDMVMGQCLMVLDSLDMQELHNYADSRRTLATGCTMTKYEVTIYFADNSKKVMRRPRF